MQKGQTLFYIQAILAGILIGLGDIVYVATESHILGSFLFSLGLLSILIKGYPLYIAQILRNGEYTDPYMAGMHEGLNMLDVLPLEK